MALRTRPSAAVQGEGGVNDPNAMVGIPNHHRFYMVWLRILRHKPRSTILKSQWAGHPTGLAKFQSVLAQCQQVWISGFGRCAAIGCWFHWSHWVPLESDEDECFRKEVALAAWVQ